MLVPYFWPRWPAKPLTRAVWVAWCIEALLIPIALALLNLLVPRLRQWWWKWPIRAICSQPLFWISATVALFLCRFPVLLSGPTNVDEAEFTAAALKLFVDPVYFRAADVNTSGPLNIYPLMLPALFGYSPDYASGRVVSLVLMLASLYVLYRALLIPGSRAARAGNEKMARIAILPALGFFCFAAHPDFMQYGSETVSMLLTSLAVWACLRIVWRPEPWTAPLLWLGALISMAFFAKMQSVPILASAAVVGAIYAMWNHKGNGSIVTRLRPFLLVAAGAVPLTALVLIVNAVFGVSRNFWMAYLVANWGYSRSLRNFIPDFPKLAQFIIDMPDPKVMILALAVLLAVSVYRSFRGNPRSAWVVWLETAVVGGMAITVALRWFSTAGKSNPPNGPWIVILGITVALAYLMVADFRRGSFGGGATGALSIAMLAGCVLCFYSSHNTFPHYLSLLTIPVSTTVGWLLLRQSPRANEQPAGAEEITKVTGMALAAGVLVAAMVAGAVFMSTEEIGYKFSYAQQRSGSPEGMLIASLAQGTLTPSSPPQSGFPATSGSTIEVWGWRPELYVSAGMVPATRDTNMSRFFLYGKNLSDFYIARFMADIQKRPPVVLIDALDVSCCYLDDRNKEGFETIPVINAYIREHYVYLGEKDQHRYYMRRDLMRPGLGQEMKIGGS